MKRAAALMAILLAVCLYAVADPDPAINTHTQASDFVRFGKQDMAHGLATTALYYFDEALKLEPNFPDALLGRARALEKLKRYSEGRAAVDKVLQLQPDNKAAWALQGRIQYDERNYIGSLASFDRALTLDNSDTMVYRWKGESLDSLGRHDEALNAYTKATPRTAPYHGGITRLTSGGPKATNKTEEEKEDKEATQTEDNSPHRRQSYMNEDGSAQPVVVQVIVPNGGYYGGGYDDGFTTGFYDGIPGAHELGRRHGPRYIAGIREPQRLPITPDIGFGMPLQPNRNDSYQGYSNGFSGFEQNNGDWDQSNGGRFYQNRGHHHHRGFGGYNNSGHGGGGMYRRH